MKNGIVLMLFSFGITGLLYTYYLYNQPSVKKVISGFIIEKESNNKTFYVQDNEGGDFVQLLFDNERSEDLTFDDFDQVEVIGEYNSRSKVLTVDEIFMLEADQVIALIN